MITNTREFDRRAELIGRHARAQDAYQDALERVRAANEYLRIREEALQKTWDALQATEQPNPKAAPGCLHPRTHIEKRGYSDDSYDYWYEDNEVCDVCGTVKRFGQWGF